MSVPDATEDTPVIDPPPFDPYSRNSCPSPCCTFTVASITALASTVFMGVYINAFIHDPRERKDASPIVWSILVSSLSLITVITVLVRNRFYKVDFKSNQFC